MPLPVTSRRALRLTLAAGVTGALCATTLLGTSAVAAPGKPAGNPSGKSVELSLAGTYATDVFDESAAEIPAFDSSTDTIFVVNAESGAVDVLDLGADGIPEYRDSIAVAGLRTAGGSVDGGAVVNSVAVSRGILVVAVEAAEKVQPGWVLFFSTKDLGYLGGVRAGSLPDAVAFTPNGRYAVVANEGEPDEHFETDPEGTISVISVPRNVNQFRRLSQDSVRTVDFREYDNGTPLPEGVRVFGDDVPVPADQEPVGPVARNLEPEYVTIDATGRTAYVSIQEANAIAVVDIASATLSDLWALELTDWSTDGELDVSDRDPRPGVDEDSSINLDYWPVMGVPMPDGIATYRYRGQDLVVTANEGDSREWGEFDDSERAGDFTLCAGDPNGLLADEKLGRLDVLTDLGYDKDDDCFNQLYAFGARSFSIYTADGERLFDSFGLFEETIADLIEKGTLPETAFNTNHDEQPSFESRSDNKGVEPEAIEIGRIQGRTYAFVGLERMGGVMVFDITDPHDASYVDYVYNRDFSLEFEGAPHDDPEETPGYTPAVGDLGAEGLEFIAASDSPTGGALLVVANEVSGTTTVFEVTPTRTR